MTDRLKEIRRLAEQILALLDEQPANEAQVELPLATPAKKITVEEVKATLTALAGAKGGAVVKALLRDFGAEKMSDVAAEDYAQLLEAAKWKGE